MFLTCKKTRYADKKRIARALAQPILSRRLVRCVCGVI
jgi:hypothetical protein